MPYLDNAGPTLYVNSASEVTLQYLAPLLKVVHKRFVSVDSAELSFLPKMTVADLLKNDIIQGILLYLIIIVLITV